MLTWLTRYHCWSRIFEPINPLVLVQFDDHQFSFTQPSRLSVLKNSISGGGLLSYWNCKLLIRIEWSDEQKTSRHLICSEIWSCDAREMGGGGAHYHFPNKAGKYWKCNFCETELIRNVNILGDCHPRFGLFKYSQVPIAKMVSKWYKLQSTTITHLE